MTLTKTSGCKINLLLNILGKRADGFHELESVMQPVPLFDELDFRSGGVGVRLTCDNPALPCDGTNLIVKAARAFQIATGITPQVGIHLRKRIPMEAGLGGGSANAATTLLGLNELSGNPLSITQLHATAAALGSDVPFFLQANPALATGRGERVKPLAPFGALYPLTLLLVHPGFGISTPWAYQALARFPDALNGQPGRANRLIDALQASTGEGAWSGQLYNSLEAPAFWKYAVLHLYVEEFKTQGAFAAMMSGSGSTVFAWFSNRLKAEQGLEKFRSRFGDRLWSAILP